MSRRKDLFVDPLSVEPKPAQESKTVTQQVTPPEEPRANKRPGAPSVRATFVIDPDVLERFKRYCFKHKLTQRAGIEQAMTMLTAGEELPERGE